MEQFYIEYTIHLDRVLRNYCLPWSFYTEMLCFTSSYILRNYILQKSLTSFCFTVHMTVSVERGSKVSVLRVQKHQSSVDARCKRGKGYAF